MMLSLKDGSETIDESSEDKSRNLEIEQLEVDQYFITATQASKSWSFHVHMDMDGRSKSGYKGEETRGVGSELVTIWRWWA